MPMMSIVRILLIDEVDEDNTVVVMSQSFLILRSLPVPPEKMKIYQQIAKTCLIIKYQQQSPQKVPTQFCTYRLISMLLHSVTRARVAEVVQRYEGPSPLSLDSDENFKP